MRNAYRTGEQKERIEQALAAGSRLGASDLRLIDLGTCKRRLGEAWSRIKPTVHAHAAEAIEAELGPSEFYVETKNGYAIFFFGEDLTLIQTTADRITTCMRRRLSAEPVLSGAPFDITSTSVNADELLRSLDAGGTPATAARPAFRKYAPLWHAKLQRVVGSIHFPHAPRTMRISDSEYYSPAEAHARQDIGAFNAMLSDVYKLQKAGVSSTIVFSVNFKTFCAPQYNKEYMLALKQAPGKLLQFLTPRFVRIPPGTPQTLLASKVQSLSSVFKHVVLHTRPVFDTTMFDCVPCSILAASWSDISYLAGRDPRGQRQPIDIARQFCQAARKLRVNALIEGLDSAAAFGNALDAGVDFGSGAAIRPLLEAPSTQSTLTVDDICGRTAAKGVAPSDIFEIR